MEETKITITLNEYNELNKIKYKYNNILAIIFNNSFLSYRNELEFDCDEIGKMLKIFEPTSYKLRVTQLSIKGDNNASNE